MTTYTNTSSSVNKLLVQEHRERLVRTGFKLLIDGELVEGASALDVINPATGKTLTVSPRADRDQLDQAVAAARSAFPGWSATPIRQRGALLVRLADALETEQNEFARRLKGFSTCRQERDVCRMLIDLLAEARNRLHNVLAVVEDKQKLPVAQRIDQTRCRVADRDEQA